MLKEFKCFTQDHTVNVKARICSQIWLSLNFMLFPFSWAIGASIIT